jgi:hypothetical protein
VVAATEPWEAPCVCEPQVSTEVVWEPVARHFQMWYRGGWGSGRIGVATPADGQLFHKDPRSPVHDVEQPHVFNHQHHPHCTDRACTSRMQKPRPP